MIKDLTDRYGNKIEKGSKVVYSFNGPELYKGIVIGIEEVKNYGSVVYIKSDDTGITVIRHINYIVVI